jgi:N-acetylmuramoyl-L-alanine amidase
LKKDKIKKITEKDVNWNINKKLKNIYKKVSIKKIMKLEGKQEEEERN